MSLFLKEFELRKHARQEGRRYCDPVVLTYQAERMPEQIRLKVRYDYGYNTKSVGCSWKQVMINSCLSHCSCVLMCVCVLQVGGVDPKQLAVYEEFARNVPGFLPSNDLSQPTGFLAQPMKVILFLVITKTQPNSSWTIQKHMTELKVFQLMSGNFVLLFLTPIIWFLFRISATGMGHRWCSSDLR